MTHVLKMIDGSKYSVGDDDGKKIVDRMRRLQLLQVHLYEVLLYAHLYRAAQVAYGMRSPHAENQRSVWRSVLSRVSRGAH